MNRCCDRRFVSGLFGLALVVWGITSVSCVVGRFVCESKADCASGLLCVNQECRECSTDSDCGLGFSCQQGRCRANGKETKEEPRRERVREDGGSEAPPEEAGAEKEPTQEASEVLKETTPERAREIPEETTPERKQEEPSAEEDVREEPSAEEPSVEEPPTEKERCAEQGKREECYTGPPDTFGVGVCKKGWRVCDGSSWGECQDEVTPIRELCDEKDNDCDGEVDEAWRNKKGTSCLAGKGICERRGVWVCRADKTGLKCDATPGSGKQETCDNKDNDCNGKIDDGLFRSCYPSTRGCTKKNGTWSCVGTCKEGKETCSQGTWGSCTQANTPAPRDFCLDKKDNDCDGQVDEDCCLPSKEKKSSISVSIQDMSIHAFGTQLAVASGRRPRLLTVPGLASLALFPSKSNNVLSIAYEPNGKHVVTSVRNVVEVYSASSRNVIRTFSNVHSGSVLVSRFSATGRWLATGSTDRKVIVWDVAQWKPLKTLLGHLDSVGALAFHPRSATLASGSADKNILIWNVSSGSLSKTFKGHTARVRGVAYSHDGSRLASIGEDKKIILWNTSTSKPILSFSTGTDIPTRVGWSPNGAWLAIGFSSGTLQIREAWNLKLAKTFRFAKPVSALTWKRDSKTLLVGSSQGEIRLFQCP